MKPFGTNAFAHHVLLGLLVTIAFGGTVGLGTVWVRHQISVVADNNRALQQQISEVERHIADADALVEAALSPDVLRRQNDAMRLGLVEMTQPQVLKVNEDPMRRFVARANVRAAEAQAEAGRGVRVQFNLGPAADAAPLPAPSAAARSAITGIPTSGGRLQFASSQ